MVYKRRATIAAAIGWKLPRLGCALSATQQLPGWPSDFYSDLYNSNPLVNKADDFSTSPWLDCICP
jgi:hypothetical protein